MDVDLDELIKRAHTPNFKNHGKRRLGPTNVPFNGIPSIYPLADSGLAHAPILLYSTPYTSFL